MTDKIFVDTNVWVYLYLHDDDEKYRIAEEYLSKSNPDVVFIITWQIINEVANTLLRYKYTESEIRKLYNFCQYNFQKILRSNCV